MGKVKYLVGEPVYSPIYGFQEAFDGLVSIPTTSQFSVRTVSGHRGDVQGQLPVIRRGGDRRHV